MTNLNKQIFSVIAAGSMILSVSAPAFAATTIEISGNGAGSNNSVQNTQVNTTTVNQTNSANVNNTVTSNANTGNNDANFNTGGNVTVKTGAAQTAATVTNTLNSNAAQVAGCNCAGNTDVKIADNGAFSKNQVGLTNVNTNAVNQVNAANVNNTVNNNANSGDNDANLNTGGNVTIDTGLAKAISNVKTVANSNTAVVGGGMGSAGIAPTASFRILGNGAGSQNWITATLVDANTLNQTNAANINNNVNANAESGDNDANFNTGGDVTIKTGAAVSVVGIDNMTNFNVANLDCGCVFDVLAKIDGNGASPLFGTTSDGIVLSLTNANAVNSVNGANLNNTGNANSETGDNDTNLNTGATGAHIDPSIMTGDATNVTTVNNSGNVNTVGSTPFVIPMPGNTTVGISFSIQALLSFFGMTI